MNTLLSPQTEWETYVAHEIPHIAKLIAPYHLSLSSEQPHIKGERFLMQALTTIGGRKVILLGVNTKTNEPVVIKASKERSGRNELHHERRCRTLLHQMKFSYESFHSPKEVLFLDTKGYTIFVSAFVPQTVSFLERPLEEQFSYALRGFKAQERTRATTAKHFAQVKHVFGTRTHHDYLKLSRGFLESATYLNAPDSTRSLMEDSHQKLVSGVERIEQYCGFLTHTDFVPHNIRICNDTLYLLDFSSLRFGNKHEGWARFLNFMTLYNRELEAWLLLYMKHNRSVEEQESLQLMRLYRLEEIIVYYLNTLKKSEGNLLTLNQARVTFWSEVLRAEWENTRVSDTIVEHYRTTRDALRSESEKERQIGLH